MKKASMDIHEERHIEDELERLRAEVDGPPNLDTLTLNIQRLTASIHASYIFENEGKSVLQMLCLLLSSTASGKFYGGWQEFAAELGLSTEQIRCIEYDFKGLEDPTYYVLLTYAQSPDGTLDKVFHALQKIKRLDVINRIKNYVDYFIKALTSTEADKDSFLKSKNIPRAPLVLRPIILMNENSRKHEDGNFNVSQDSEITEIRKKSSESAQTYGSVAMLTFVEDGADTAYHIAKVFRSREPKIGVVILQEQERYVYSRAEEFIDDCFMQVNYIVPILTKGYLETIDGHVNAQKQISTLDAKYSKYVYSLLRHEYVKNHCCNFRTRCIVPDKQLCNIHATPLHPTLQAWFKESDVESFADNILLRKF
ncbi:uncharacterized protein LOC105704284 [Orussus abietinus]|uniref:uncharacterized protein LOC105704284 n=1 Tax=Orussus abietinus TaxID=222816 RepID=UPI000626DCBE|nr:uncharacterized protein LOC105704284 [Orussus abietinus]